MYFIVSIPLLLHFDFFSFILYKVITEQMTHFEVGVIYLFKLSVALIG